VRQLLRERAAIVLDDTKQYLVDSRLSQLARREGLASAQDVIDRLRAAPAGPLQRKVIEAMTTTETLFFRDGKPYDAIRNAIRPRAGPAAPRRAQAADLSCACSSGQEPYSVGMLLREHFPSSGRGTYGWSAPTSRPRCCPRSRAGPLQPARGQPRPADGLSDEVFRQGRQRLAQIRDELRKAIEFRELNLAGPWGRGADGRSHPACATC